MRQCNCSSSIMLYLGHGLPKYEVKVETMLVFTGAHVKLGLATVLGETPWLFNMDQPKCLRGQNMSEHLRTQSFPRRVLVFLAAVHLPRLPLRLEISLAPQVALPRLGHQDAPRDIMQLFFWDWRWGEKNWSWPVALLWYTWAENCRSDGLNSGSLGLASLMTNDDYVLPEMDWKNLENSSQKA